MPGADIQVSGLRELSRSLRKVGPEHAKAMRVRFKQIADVVAESARSSVPVRSGRARGSIRARGDNRGASIIGGRASVRYYGWLDFGGTLKATGGRRNTQHRPRLVRGRFIYPAIDRHHDDIVKAAQQSVDDATREAGL